MDSLKPCPFCGHEPMKLEADGGTGTLIISYACQNLNCSFQERWMRDEKWNHRPIEDALREELRQKHNEFVEILFNKDAQTERLREQIKDLDDTRGL